MFSQYRGHFLFLWQWLFDIITWQLPSLSSFFFAKNNISLWFHYFCFIVITCKYLLLLQPCHHSNLFQIIQLQFLEHIFLLGKNYELMVLSNILWTQQNPLSIWVKEKGHKENWLVFILFDCFYVLSACKYVYHVPAW